MPLVFGAIVSHPPIAIPTIGQANLRYVRKTKKSLERLAADLYQSQPETIIMISPHGQLMDDCLIINHHPNPKGDFEKFGDFNTKLDFNNDLGFAYQIKEKLETKLPIILTTDEKLDYGVTVPLFYLAKNLKQVKVIPIGYYPNSRKINFEFGQELIKIINRSPKRIALIASADLSHCLSRKAPAKYSPLGKVFDQQMLELLQQKKHQEILNLDDELIKSASECGYNSIVMLLGAYDRLNYDFELYSYESSLGVGHLVANLILK